MDAPNQNTSRQDVEIVRGGAPPAPGSWTRKRWAWLVILGLAIAILSIVTFIMIRSGRDSRASGDEQLPAGIDRSPGSEAMLYLPGRDSVLVGVDEKALDELMNVMSARGEDAQTLIQAGRVIRVPNKTRVRIIEAGFAKLKVRILEGDNVMFEVWVPERWVR